MTGLIHDDDLIVHFEATQEARHAAVLRPDPVAELWISVSGFEGVYSVSDLGRVRSEARVIQRRGAPPQSLRQRILAPGEHTGGYRTVIFCVAAKKKTVFIHKLVLEAFRGPRPSGMEARHLNGNPADNRLANLEWGTPVENAADRKRHNRQVKGTAVKHCKLSEASVQAIRMDARSQVVVAQHFGVTQTMVSRIKLGKAWGWLK